MSLNTVVNLCTDRQLTTGCLKLRDILVYSINKYVNQLGTEKNKYERKKFPFSPAATTTTTTNNNNNWKENALKYEFILPWQN